ncbi:class I SAM-dependent methyltransferase [Nocardioides sp. Kera G14]|uniref:class I SAM-dependent methyltransferase n=1 Tax=Nocardioides sp. Kera G14 TaxID=2884264 RepID=UPI001D11EBCC|nr:class I SAM-dependent methyltransferase [Nocardioides sp. Kera G14]UDY23623.1 class I SAM-dependent methyltransferase [Nocardioides sp. Kera G14]
MSVASDSRTYYARVLEQGVDRLFLERMDCCPWCGSTSLRRRTTTRDLRQFKPGRFRLDECRACGHVFQNPPLSDEGLGFYYRDTYDGLNAERAEANLGSMSEVYLNRAGTVAGHRHDAPRRWLDVGTASGHFPAAAATLFPGTVFDGLDMSDGVLSAQRAGRIQTAHQGQFPELSGGLVGQYDQVSMFHYLEHTRDPFADLDAAVRVLSDDGWLLIEQPDPEAPSARLFGSWWAGWNQPEHLNMITLGNLRAALEDRGLEVVTVVRREAHIPLEAFIVLATLLNRFAPAGEVPWRAGGVPRFAHARRLIGKVLAAPFVPLTRLIDRVLLPRVLHSYHAYRVLARKAAPAAQG